jgi:hypothetical protein
MCGDPSETWGVTSTQWNFQSGLPTYSGLQGTSMAAPHVAGLAALLFSAYPGLTADDVRDILSTFTLDLGSPGFDTHFGYGLVDAQGSLTLGEGIPGRTRVQLRDASTGQVVQTAAADDDGAFRLSGLADGTYHLFAGRDELSDGIVGSPGRAWGAFGNAATPTAITVDGAGVQTRSFGFGIPVATGNDSPGSAAPLEVGGYRGAVLSTGSDVNYFTIRIPASGSYVIETHGWFGACGFPGSADTVIELYGPSGTLIAENDDINSTARAHCSRLTLPLAAGTHTLVVYPYNQENGSSGFYRVSAAGA